MRKTKEPVSLSEEVERLQVKCTELQKSLEEMEVKNHQARLEYDILMKAAELLKKEKGVDIDKLSNKEKEEVTRSSN